MDKEQYTYNKAAKTGTEIACPVCGRMFTKKQYSQAFCSTECKDAYWTEARKQPLSNFPKKPKSPRFIQIENDMWLNVDYITFIGKSELAGKYMIETTLQYDPFIITEEQVKQLI